MVKQNIKNKIPDIIFWATALFILFWALGDRGFWGSEDRWAEVARQMFLTGDFFHPRINATPYFDKPLLSYWFIALVSAVTGHLVVFYLDASEPIKVLEDPEAVRNFLSSDNEDKVLISYRKYTDELSKMLPSNLKRKNILKEKIYPWTSEQSLASKLVAWRINFEKRVL